MTRKEREQNGNVWQSCVAGPCTPNRHPVNVNDHNDLGELAEWLRSGLQIRNDRVDFIKFLLRQIPRTFRERIANVWQRHTPRQKENDWGMGEQQFCWANAGPTWDRVRAVLFEPCRTAQRGLPWEDMS